MIIYSDIQVKDSKYYIISNNTVQAQTNTKEKAKELVKDFAETDKKIFKNLSISYWIIQGKLLNEKFTVTNKI